MTANLLIAIIGAGLIVAGVGLFSIPAGLIMAGVQLITAALLIDFEE